MSKVEIFTIWKIYLKKFSRKHQIIHFYNVWQIHITSSKKSYQFFIPMLQILKYTIRAPFDKFIQCNNPTQWFKDPTPDLDTYAKIADEVKMVKQQVLIEG